MNKGKGAKKKIGKKDMKKARGGAWKLTTGGASA